MAGALRRFFAEGEAALLDTAGEPCRFIRRGQAEGDGASLMAVVGPAPLEYQLEGPGGAMIAVTATALLSKSALRLAPAPGDRLVDAGGRLLEVVKVNSAGYDASWHVDLVAVRVAGAARKGGVR